MNTATNYEPTPTGNEAADLPPVLVRVPWLGAKQAASAGELARATKAPALDRRFFEPHQLVAAADMEVTDFGTVRTQWRIDPPQDGPITAEVHHRRPVVASTAPAPPTVLPPTLPVRQVTTPASDGITHLRFDPPVTSIIEPPVQHAQQSASTDVEPSLWHETVTALDVFLSRYQRIIMLVALIAAAGLMAVVIDSRRPANEPAPDGGAPSTIDTTDIGAMPLADVTHAHEPAAIPERVAMAQGPRSNKREPVSSMNDETVAPLMLEPIAPHREPHPPITPIEGPDETSEPDTYPTTGYPTTGYPSTGDPAFELSFPTTAASESVAPRGASLSQDIRPVPQQIKQ